MTRRQVNAIREVEAQGGRLEDNWVQSARHADIELKHGMIPCTLNPRDFTERLLSAVNIATAYREDVDQWSDERKASADDAFRRHYPRRWYGDTYHTRTPRQLAI
jgi:hypothetical protein